MATFNPYHKWLGISLKEQPPNHYRLLGIDVFESDPEVIEAAADRQMAYIHQCASGDHVEESQKLLNELSQARVCLLNHGKKAKYDTTLQSQPPAGSASAYPLRETANKALPVTKRADSRKRRRSSWSSPKLFSLIGIAIVLLVVAGVIVSRNSDSGNSEPTEQPVAQNSGEQASDQQNSSKTDPISTAIAQSKIEIGDCIVVTSKDASIRILEKDITVPLNKSLLVEKVKDGWVWVSFKKQNTSLAGWIDRDYVRNCSLMSFLGHRFNISSVSFSPDGKYIVSSGGRYPREAGGGELKLWDATNGKEIVKLKGYRNNVPSTTFSPDGRRLAAGSGVRDSRSMGELHVWEPTTGRLLWTVKKRIGRVNSVCFSPDGKRIASGSTDRTVRIWDAKSGKELMVLRGHTDQAYWVCYNPAGDRLASSGHDGTIRLWNAQNGQAPITILTQQRAIYKISFSPDGKRLASPGHDRKIKIWDSTTGRNLLTIKGNQGGILRVAYSPDGKRLVSGGADGTVKIWNADTGQLHFTLLGHSGSVHHVNFDPTGKRVVSAGFLDLTVKVWNVDDQVGRKPK